MILESPEVPKAFKDAEKILASAVTPEAGQGNQRPRDFLRRVRPKRLAPRQNPGKKVRNREDGCARRRFAKLPIFLDAFASENS